MSCICEVTASDVYKNWMRREVLSEKKGSPFHSGYTWEGRVHLALLKIDVPTKIYNGGEKIKMIYLAYLGEAKKLEHGNNSKKYFIVRRPVSGIPKGFIHLPHLSPSAELLENAQRWKRKEFNDEERLKLLKKYIDIESDDAWWVLYEPIFRKELEIRKDVRKGIEIIRKDIQDRRDVYLFCYCKDVDRCHRVLVGEYLEQMGFEVDFRREKIEEENFCQLNMFGEKGEG